MELLRRLRDTYLSVSASSFGRVTKVVDHCPHCEADTPWVVRALTGYVRCTECGRNPMQHKPTRDGRPPTEPSRPETPHASSRSAS